MTTSNLTTSQAAARAGISYQRLRQIMAKGVYAPKPATREGCGPRGGGYLFEPAEIDRWVASRPARKGRKGASVPMDPAKQARLEAAGWRLGSAEDFLSSNDAPEEVEPDPTDLTGLGTLRSPTPEAFAKWAAAVAADEAAAAACGEETRCDE